MAIKPDEISPQQIILDGTAQLTMRSDGVFITITAPLNAGRPVDFAHVQRLVTAKEIQEVDWERLQAAIKEATGAPVKIAERKPELDRDALIRVEVDKDELGAVAEVTPARGGRRLSLADVQAVLNEATVKEGLKTEQITALLTAQDIGGKFVVATGRPPANGVDGYVQYRFATDKPDVRPMQLDDGSVDYYNLQLVQSVSRGQVLAERVAPTAGMPGVTVTGRVLPAKPGKEARFGKGKNVEVSEDGNSLFASIAGQVTLMGDKVGVHAVHEVRGDVDFGTGNIDFVGNVVVAGGVKSGFTIRAGGNVEIRGSVEAATIIAEGDIFILRGVQGGERGQIHAGGSLKARFLQQCSVRAGVNVEVDEAIMYCDVQAGARVEARGSKGRIVGGLVRACEEVAARVIGSRLATKTEIEVGVTPEIRAEFNKANEDLVVRQRQYEQVSKGLQTLKAAQDAGRCLTANDAELAKQLVEKASALRDEVDRLDERRRDLDSTIVAASRGVVKAYDTAHPGVKVTIGHLSMHVRDDLAKPLFYISEGEIRLGSA